MKKLILFLFLITNIGFSQSGYFNRIQVTDSIYNCARINAGSYYLNGVLQTFGGSSFDLTAYHLWSGINYFTNGTYFEDSVRVTGQVIFDSTLSVGGYVIATDSVKGNALSAGDMFLNNNGSGIYWRAYSSYINEGVDELFYSSKTHNFVTKNGNNYIAILDSASGFNLAYGVFAGNGSGLTTLNASNLSSGTILQSRFSDSVYKLSNLDTTRFLDQSDTSSFFRVGDVLSPAITEIVNSLVTFSTAVTFIVSPVFSAVVNFPYGITTTTITASSTATFNGDLVPTWVKNNSSVSAYQYEKTKIIAFKLGATTATTYTSAHGITDWHTIKSYTVGIMDDSSNTLILPNVNSDDAGSAGKLYNNANIDSLNCRVRLLSGSINLVNDSVFFRIVYTDYNR